MNVEFLKEYREQEVRRLHLLENDPANLTDLIETARRIAAIDFAIREIEEPKP